MQRFRRIFLVALTIAALSAFFVAGSVSAQTNSCSWHVVQTASVSNGYSTVGTVQLLRDGCGDIQATLTASGNGLAVVLYTADGTSIGGNGTSSFSGTISTPIYSGYGGVGVKAFGFVFKNEGNQGQAFTAVDYSS